MKAERVSRRQFLRKGAAAAGAAASFHLVPRHVLGGPGRTPPSETITRGVIGTGYRGTVAHTVINEEHSLVGPRSEIDLVREILVAIGKAE